MDIRFCFTTVVFLTGVTFVVLDFLTFSADVPLAHGIHSVSPSPFVYVPFSQAVHFNDPSASVTEFLGHFVHADSPLKALNDPASHFLQSAANVAFVLFPYVPSGHSLHLNCSV